MGIWNCPTGFWESWLRSGLWLHFEHRRRAISSRSIPSMMRDSEGLRHVVSSSCRGVWIAHHEDPIIRKSDLIRPSVPGESRQTFHRGVLRVFRSFARHEKVVRDHGKGHHFPVGGMNISG